SDALSTATVVHVVRISPKIHRLFPRLKFPAVLTLPRIRKLYLQNNTNISRSFIHGEPHIVGPASSTVWAGDGRIRPARTPAGTRSACHARRRSARHRWRHIV